jgi:peptidyl-prolyl cis-trans isomerase A (cyclophilin A)
MFSISSFAADSKATGTDDLVPVGMNTSVGYIELELNKTKAPISVANFLSYVNSGHYNGTVFHRVIKDFMVQGGGFGADMRQKSTQPAIKNEADNGLKNDRGTIAMARTASIDSATSQFFINVKDNTFLNNGVRDFGYAVFGKVVTGMAVVDAMANSQTGARDVPVQPIILYDVRIIDDLPKAALK